MIKTEKLLFSKEEKVEVYKVRYDTEIIENFLSKIIKKYRRSYAFDFAKGQEIPKEFIPFDERVIHHIELCNDGYKINAGIVHVYPTLVNIFISDIKRRFGGYNIETKPVSSILKTVDDYTESNEDIYLHKRTKSSVLNQYFSLYTLEACMTTKEEYSKNQLEEAQENTKHLENIRKKGIKILEKVK